MNLLEPIVLPNIVVIVLLRLAAALVISSCFAAQWFFAKQIWSARTDYLAYTAHVDKFVKKNATVIAKNQFNRAEPGEFKPRRGVRLTYTYEMLGREWSSYCMSFSKCSAKPEEFSTVLGKDISQIKSGDSITTYVTQEIPVTAYLKIDSVDEARTSLHIASGFWVAAISLCFLVQWWTWRAVRRSKNIQEEKSLL